MTFPMRPASRHPAAPQHHFLSSVYVTLVVTATIQALVAMAAVSVPVFAPDAARDLGIAATLVGYFIGMMYIGASFAALVSGGLILRFGAIRVSQVALLLCTAALILLTVLPLAWIPLAAVMLGAGYGPTTPASSHILMRTTPPHMMALVFSIKQSGVPVGAALAGVILPPLTVAFGWRVAALTVAALCAAVALLVQGSRRELDADRDPRRPLAVGNLALPFRLIFASADLKRNVLAALAYAGLQITFFTYVVAYLTHDFAYTLVAAGLALSCANVGAVTGRIFWGFVADRSRAPQVVLGILGVAMALVGLTTATFSAAWPYGLVLAVCVLFGFTAVGWNGVQIAETARLAPPGMAGVVSSGTTFVMFFGVVFYPPMFAVIHDAADSYPVAIVTLAIPAMVMGIVQLVRSRQRK